MKKLRILLADDHTIVREGLRLLINGQPDMRVIAEAGDGKEVLRKVKELNPDLVVMDLSMPQMNGLQATETLRAARSGVKVIALTVHEDVNYLRQLIRAGSDGYVLKRSAGDQLIRAIQVVAQGGVYFDASLAGEALASKGGSPTGKGSPHSSDLSNQEKKVLSLLAWGHSNKDIAGQLGLSIKTIETYKARAVQKLGLRSRAEIVQYALRRGWLNESEPPVRPAR